MEVDPRGSRWAVEHEGRTYYFCSERCQRAFLEDPERYLAHGRGGASHIGCCGPAMGGGWLKYICLFILFLPFHKKSYRRPTSIYLAFIVASALEMFGIPLSLYVVAWALGVYLPSGFLWGHTLHQYIGYWGMYIGFTLNLVGGALIILGWRSIYKGYWGRADGERRLVTEGVYSLMRHPQYTGFILMTLGLLIHWATLLLLLLLLMYPPLVYQYYRLARREEELEGRFGEEYRSYRERVSMFLPLKAFKLRLWGGHAPDDT
jgi:protein-S-isoprenylcysteine O-methyltransferase Ste14/YHS domain-containing protein